MTDDTPSPASTRRLTAALAEARPAQAWRAFRAWFAERFLNAETGLGLWLLAGSPAPLVALISQPENALYAVAWQLGVIGTALGGWLLFVNPVKRQAKRQAAVAHRLTAMSVKAYRNKAKGRGDAR